MKNFKSILMAIVLGLGLSQATPVFSGANSGKKVLNVFGSGASEGMGWWIDALTKKILGESFVNKHPKVTAGLFLGAAGATVLGAIVLCNGRCKKEEQEEEKNENQESPIGPKEGGVYED